MAKLLIMIDMLYLDAQAEGVVSWAVNTLATDPELEISLLDLKEWFIPTDDNSGVQLIQKAAPPLHRNKARLARADCLVILCPPKRAAGDSIITAALAAFPSLWRDLPTVLISYGPAATEQTDANRFLDLQAYGLRAAVPALYLQLNHVGEGGLIFGLTVEESLRHRSQDLCAVVGGRLSTRKRRLS